MNVCEEWTVIVRMLHKGMLSILQIKERYKNQWHKKPVTLIANFLLFYLMQWKKQANLFDLLLSKIITEKIGCLHCRCVWGASAKCYVGFTKSFNFILWVNRIQTQIRIWIWLCFFLSLSAKWSSQLLFGGSGEVALNTTEF